MNDTQLIDYIKTQIKNNVSPEKIKLALLSSGWLEDKVNEAFLFLGIQAPQTKNINSTRFKTQVTKPFSKKFLLWFVLCVLICVAGGVYLYFNYFLSPKRILLKSLKKMDDVNIMGYAGELDLELTGKDLFNNKDLNSALPIDISSLAAKNSKLSLQIAAVSDISDIYNPKCVFKLTSTPNKDNPNFNIGAEIRYFGKDSVYANLSDIPANFFGNLNFSLLEDKWIEFDLKDFSNKTASVNSEKNDENKPPKIVFTIEKVKEELPGLIKEVKEAAGEKNGDIDLYHYELSFDNKKLSQLYFDLSANNNNLTELQLKNLKEKADSLESVTGDVWVGKKDLLIHRIHLIIDQKNNTGKIELVLQIKNHNVPIAIEMPAKAKKLKELMNEILLSVLSGGKMETIDSDGDSISDFDEKNIWNTDPNNTDTDKDGYLDGDEIKNGFNPNGAGKLPAS